MPAVKVGPKHQVTIPKEIFETLDLKAGDLIEASVKGGKIILTPKQLTDKLPIARLSRKEQQVLAQAREKIARIQANLRHSQGLSDDEIKVAVKVGLIDQQQAWWWHENWQKGEREAEQAVEKGELFGPFETSQEAINSLKSAAS